MSFSTNRIYALLVGINDYSPCVGKLRGCLNDLDGLRDWLISAYGPARLLPFRLRDPRCGRLHPGPRPVHPCD